ncbi:DUF4112 domain-containing protein [Aestuariivirga litoralis]|uniref:DUF4112 domain-containing protein n=1 Tax=Aestuariivirga litoralis TaxID=2650924 RepID=UPI0018C5BF50|nr:DUF4112 domain-containing protein [Aestuariivirga litoralis]
MEHTETIKTMKRLKWMALVMDSKFGIPFTRFRFGVDTLSNAVPFAGNAVMTMASLYMVWKAYEMGAPRGLLARMVGNVAVEAGLGAIPVVGIVLDTLYMANIRNVEMLAEFLRAQGVMVE